MREEVVERGLISIEVFALATVARRKVRGRPRRDRRWPIPCSSRALGWSCLEVANYGEVLHQILSPLPIEIIATTAHGGTDIL